MKYVCQKLLIDDQVNLLHKYRSFTSRLKISSVRPAAKKAYVTLLLM